MLVFTFKELIYYKNLQIKLSLKKNKQIIVSKSSRKNTKDFLKIS